MRKGIHSDADKIIHSKILKRNRPSIRSIQTIPNLQLDYFGFLRMQLLSRGIIYLDDEIGQGSGEEVFLQIYELLNREIKKLRLILTSPGGNVFDGLAVYDALSEYKKQGGYITIETKGYAASMGAIILQAGDERHIAQNAKILIHEVSNFNFGIDTASDAEDKTIELKKLNEQLVSILALRSGMSKAKILSLIKKKDCWLTAKEALELNLVDKII